MAAARAFFPNSPADEGPFSGSGWVDKSGLAIGESFAAGIDQGTAGVVAATDDMMQQVRDLLNSPQSAEGLTQLLDLQSQLVDMQSAGNVSKDAKAEATRMKDFNSLIQARIKLRNSELQAATNLNNTEVKAWADAQRANGQKAKGIGQQAADMKAGFKDALSPLTEITPDLLMGQGKSNIYKAGEVDSITKAELDNLKIKQQQLDMQKQLLQLRMKGSDDPALKQQMDILEAQKQRLGLQSQELEYWSKYVDTGRDVQDAWAKAGDTMISKSMDIGKSTGMSYLNELGISGNGMIPNLLTEGSKYIFQVSGIDDALSLQKNLVNQQTLGITGR